MTVATPRPRPGSDSSHINPTFSRGHGLTCIVRYSSGAESLRTIRSLSWSLIVVMVVVVEVVVVVGTCRGIHPYIYIYTHIDIHTFKYT